MSDSYYRITTIDQNPTFGSGDERLLDWLCERADNGEGVWIADCYWTLTCGTIKEIIRLAEELELDAETVAAFRAALEVPNAFQPGVFTLPLTDDDTVSFYMV